MLDDFTLWPSGKSTKQGDRTLCSNWRGISLLSVVGKLVSFHTKPNSLLKVNLNSQSQLRNEQNVFRPNSSSADHVIRL